jgi:phosphate acetyltransferase
MQYIENKTFDELNVGDRAELTRTLRKEDIELFAVMSGDVNPAHVDEAFAKTDQFHKVIAHGMWGGALISAVLGTELPGPGTIYLNQSLSFRRPVGLGDTVTVRVTVREKLPEKKRLLLDCECVNQSGEIVIKGEANVIAPTEKVRRPRALLPEVHLHERGLRYRQLIEEARKSPAIRTAVVYPCDSASLSCALDCAGEKLIVPVLVGPEDSLRKIADDAKLDLKGIEIVGAVSSLAAADRAVALAREGRVDALLRGALPTQELMAAVMKPLTGLRTERRMSHVLAFDVPNYPKPLFVTDAAINGHPDLPTKRDIVRNAIELTHALGIAEPKVAVLSAIETVVPKLASRIDAAALRKMSEWGQITGALVDGPLAFDTAVSKQAAKHNGIDSRVAGDADILVCPDLEAANAVANLLIYLAGADAAGIVLGARVPILLRTHAGNALSRQASAGLAQLVSHYVHGAAARPLSAVAR